MEINEYSRKTDCTVQKAVPKVLTKILIGRASHGKIAQHVMNLKQS